MALLVEHNTHLFTPQRLRNIAKYIVFFKSSCYNMNILFNIFYSMIFLELIIENKLKYGWNG